MKRIALSLLLLLCPTSVSAAAEWPQFQGNALRSGNAPEAEIPADLGLLGAVPLTDGVYAGPAVAGQTVYVVDGSGVVHAVCTETLKVRWTFATRGGPGNVNNVSSPAVVGPYLHLGTMSGCYYVLDRESGNVVAELDCREPIFSAPAVGDDRVYFATLGARVYAVEPDGTVAWTWDFVREVVDFHGDRWSGESWLKARGDRVTWRDHFVCSRDISLIGRTVVIPAGGRTVFLDDAGAAPELRAVGEIPDYHGREYPATFGQSADEAGNVYVQWHRRDNAGRLDVLRLSDERVETRFVPGTRTYVNLPDLLSVASVSIRDGNVYRVRPEQGRGLCRHAPGVEEPEVLCEAASISPPVLTREHAVYGGLDGRLHVVPLAGGEAASYPTAFGKPISAPLAVAGGRVYVGGEDGYLYVFGAGGRGALPTKSLGIEKIRSPLTGPMARPEYDWYTNYGDFSSTNSNNQGLALPLRMRWAHRLAGTVKHLPVCGGGRLYLHTAEGQVIAMEQDTGRLLWRRYSPGVYLSFTSPLYVGGKLLVPQVGIRQSMVRCLDAATGELLWEAPFTGTPSWSRQFPPLVHGNVAIYASGSGEYAPQGSERSFTFRGDPEAPSDGREVMSFIYTNDNPYYQRDNRPLLWAWNLETGELVWQRDFSEYGRGGNDCGICLYDGKLYYSTFFGYAASQRARRGLPPDHNGLTACLDPATGEVVWLTTEHFVTAKCTVTGRDGRIYLGGHNRASEDTNDRFVWCLDARDGSLIWRSDPVTSALNVITVGERFIFCNALRGRGNVFDRETGKVVGGVDHNYACCRFTMSGPYVLGANMDMIDLASDGKLVSTGPAIDSRECLGAVISNGRMFYVSQASGFVVSQTYGAEARRVPAVWERNE
jgi:outer membrane protein assembly factor BamB